MTSLECTGKPHNPSKPLIGRQKAHTPGDLPFERKLKVGSCRVGDVWIENVCVGGGGKG